MITLKYYEEQDGHCPDREFKIKNVLAYNDADGTDFGIYIKGERYEQGYDGATIAKEYPTVENVTITRDIDGGLVIEFLDNKGMSHYKSIYSNFSVEYFEIQKI